MSAQPFKIPRLNDREIVEKMNEMAIEFSLSKPKLFFIPFEGASGKTIPLTEYEQNVEIKPLLDLSGAGIYHFRFTTDDKNLFTIRRDSKNIYDEIVFNWDETRGALDETVYAKFITIAKQKFKELKINEAFSGFPNEEINRYYEARDATLTRLETINQELLYGMHKRQLELDDILQKKVLEIENKFLEKHKILQKEFEVKEQSLKEKEEAFKKKESEFETSESKYTRRKLRQDMLKRLAELSEKFQLTTDTRRLRWPILIVISFFILFFGTLTVLAFSQTVEILNAAGQDATKINWWILGLLTLKQLAFASAFIGGSWFLIKWNDRWFRQHADAEFNFKQLELDINRASWVFEMALEWKDEKGRELPPELLDRLTKNLFKDVSQSANEIDAPTDVASILLGSASNVKFKAGNGTEIEFDRKGINNALKG